jgi:hypothetical protein
VRGFFHARTSLLSEIRVGRGRGEKGKKWEKVVEKGEKWSKVGN